MAKRVLVLGGTGMLGSMVIRALMEEEGLALTATVRSEELLQEARKRIPGAEWRYFDARKSSEDDLRALVSEADWVVNAIGITKPYMKVCDTAELENAVDVNCSFPLRLGRLADELGTRVIQIATDCVYSGRDGKYDEEAVHDAIDEYGKSKSLGESPADKVTVLRCSIIGPETGRSTFLLEWFLGQPEGGSVNGFTNHDWNGVTTFHFGKLCAGLIREEPELPHLLHVLPAADVNKFELLQTFAERFDRGDISISPTEAPEVVDRTLRTKHPEANAALWKAAGYSTPPTVPEMIGELAEFTRRS